MLKGLFGWLRSSVKQAFLAGIQDAVEELQLPVEGDYPRLGGLVVEVEEHTNGNGRKPMVRAK